MNYHFRSWWRWLWLGFIGIILLFAVYLALTLWAFAASLNLTGSERNLFFALAGLLVVMTLGMAGFMGLIFRQTFLHVGERGIYFQQPGLKLSASWQDVQRIGDVPFGRLRVKGLILSQAEYAGSPLLAWMMKRTGQDKTIPLTPFMQDWQQVLARYIDTEHLDHHEPPRA